MTKKGFSTEVTNHQKLLKLLMHREGKLLGEIFRLQKEYGLQDNKEKIIKWIEDCLNSLEDREINRIDLRNVTIEFMQSLGEPLKFIEFYSKVKEVTKKYGLGDEWSQTIALMVIKGVVVPPVYNLAIEANLIDKKVIIKLNSTTTLEDISEAWNEIKKGKEEVFGKSKKEYFSKNFMNDFYLYIRSEYLKSTGLDDPTTPNKYKAKDEDILVDLLPALGEADEDILKKEINKLRQKRKRIKDKEKI